MYFKVNDKDFSHLVSNLKVGYETLVSDTSGRNAAGYTFIDVIARKTKLYVTLRHTTDSEMKEFLNAVKDYIVTVTYRSPETNALQSYSAYIGTPEPEYYTIQPGMVIYKPMSLNFIER